MTTARALVVLAAPLMALASCSADLRFDDHSIEAGVSPRDSRDEGPANCADDRCGFVGAPCTATSCRWECPQLKSCSGTCGPSCTVDCEEDSSCMLTADEGASLKCESGARCSFVVGRSGSVACQGRSDCGTRCLSSCSVSCAASAVCTLACGLASPLAAVSGSASCP